ncbi:MAG: DUF2971 domain-containing protein [Acetobacteraceae bacterium]
MVEGDAEPVLALEVERPPEIFMPPPPPRLTRFYGNIDFAKDVFRTKSIAFVHVSLMNDPFDPYFEFVTDFEGRYPAILSWIEANHGAKEVRWFKSVMPYQSWRNSLSGIKKRNANLKENSFLLCASAPLADLEPAHNLYMWGHYCSGHRGVAIEFDAERVATSVVEHQTKNHPDWPKDQRVWTPVIYQDKIDRLTAADLHEFLKAPLGRELQTKFAFHLNTVSRLKSTVWRPEQEWRLMWHNDELETKIYKVPILPGAVRRVFIGLRLTDDVAAQIAAECRATFPEAEVLKGSARPGEFALDFRPVR